MISYKFLLSLIFVGFLCAASPQHAVEAKDLSSFVNEEYYENRSFPRGRVRTTTRVLKKESTDPPEESGGSIFELLLSLLEVFLPFILSLLGLADENAPPERL